MRCYVFALLLVCGLQAQAHAFTLQSYARVNLVPAVEIQRVQGAGGTPEIQLATAIWGSESNSRISFTISGPPDLWAKVTLVDLTEEILPPEITSQAGCAGELKVIYPLPGALNARENPWRSLLLRVEYE